MKLMYDSFKYLLEESEESGEIPELAAAFPEKEEWCKIMPGEKHSIEIIME